MIAMVHASSLVGVDAHPVVVEVDQADGLPGIDVIGLPETSVRESKVRVRAALAANQFELPHRRYLLNLAPADVRKKGSAYDLAFAVGLLASVGACAPNRLARTLVLGELSISGDVRPVRGVLAQLRAAGRRGLDQAIVPAENGGEAALATDIDVRVARHLRGAIEHLNGTNELPRARFDEAARPTAALIEDLADVRGQASARRALEIAATGSHHLLFIGPPGSGKTMLARRLRGLLPPPTDAEALDIVMIAGAAGLKTSATPPVPRPFRAPHHTASVAAIVGGGDPIRPGEVTLAHAGVLFLDELPEFRRDAIEALRTTMERGEAHIARIHARVTMPARTLVVAAMNPCPCGYAGDPERVCLCPPDRVHRYFGRVSGPLLDRFDLHVAVPRLKAKEHHAEAAEPSEAVRGRVLRAIARERERGPLEQEAPVERFVIESAALDFLDQAIDRLGLSARAYRKVIRVARTIADLEGVAKIAVPHVAEALQYRVLDRKQAR